MKLSIDVKLPKDFQHVCDIFGYQPEQVLQRFMEEVSFPEFFSDPDNDHRWATLFFLYNMNAGDDELNNQLEEHQPYIDQMAEIATKNPRNSEVAYRKKFTRVNTSDVVHPDQGDKDRLDQYN